MKSKSDNQIKCRDCLFRVNASSDTQTVIANLGFRFVYSVLTWVILGKGISPGKGFFVSLCLFISPLCLDYLKYKPEECWRKLLKGCFLVITGVIFFFSVFGLCNIFDVVEVNKELVIQISKDYITHPGSSYDIKSIWYIVGMSVIFITLVDWIAAPRKNEVFIAQKMLKGAV